MVVLLYNFSALLHGGTLLLRQIEHRNHIIRAVFFDRVFRANLFSKSDIGHGNGEHQQGGERTRFWHQKEVSSLLTQQYCKAPYSQLRRFLRHCFSWYPHSRIRLSPMIAGSLGCMRKAQHKCGECRWLQRGYRNAADSPITDGDGIGESIVFICGKHGAIYSDASCPV